MGEILYDSAYFVNGKPFSIETGEPMRQATREELADLFRPEDQLSADPETMSMVFDTLSNHLFDSWTDKDLYRAIDAPEHREPGEAHDNEIAEYVAELQKRVVERARLAARSAEIRRQHGITEG